ncbi:MAG: GxxExxY protein [Planctomycetes bacterium]|nr:GxxExxY protein [Planctomycetota bacterium]
MENGRFEHKEITSGILNGAFEVHNTLGCGFMEKVYENSLVYELEQRKLKVETQKEMKVRYKEIVAGTYIADIVVEDKVIIELKVAEGISKIHEAQLLNYLKASGYRVGLILNFAKPKLLNSCEMGKRPPGECHSEPVGRRISSQTLIKCRFFTPLRSVQYDIGGVSQEFSKLRPKPS